MRARPQAGGFSLVEVVIAVGVLAIAVVGVLGLLPGMARDVGETSDAMTAQRLPAAVKIELQRLAAGGSLAPLASRIAVQGNSPTLQLVAARDGTRVQAANGSGLDSSAQLDQAERYFLIELWRFPSAPLAYDAPTGAVLPAWVKVSWPYRRPSSTAGSGYVETATEDRASFTFTVAVNR